MHGFDGAHRFEGEANLDQDAGFGRALLEIETTSGIASPERVRTRDDEHRDRSHDGIVRAPQQQPDDSGDDARCQREPEQPAGRTVSDALRLR